MLLLPSALLPALCLHLTSRRWRGWWEPPAEFLNKAETRCLPVQGDSPVCLTGGVDIPIASERACATWEWFSVMSLLFACSLLSRSRPGVVDQIKGHLAWVCSPNGGKWKQLKGSPGVDPLIFPGPPTRWR